MTKLSFQVSYTVYNCDDCPHKGYSWGEGDYCSYYALDYWDGRELYRENESGLTESCPLIKEGKNVCSN